MTKNKKVKKLVKTQIIVRFTLENAKLTSQWELGKIYLNDFEIIEKYESKYGVCEIIKQQIDKYSYSSRFENEKARRKIC